MGIPAPTFLMPVHDRFMICVRLSKCDFVFFGLRGTQIEATIIGERIHVNGKSRGRVSDQHEWHLLLAGSAIAVEMILQTEEQRSE